jgi:hypothetical protein
MHIRSVLSLFALMAAVAGAPCQAAHAQSSQLVGVPVEARDIVRGGIRLITGLELRSGASVQFLELDTGIGVAERAPPGAALVTDLLVQRWRATPLEIYLALAPAASLAPAALLRDHEQSTSTPARTLTVPVAYGVPLDNFDCDPPQNFEDDWFDTYTGVTSHVVVQSYDDFDWAQYDWYPGAHVYNGTDNNLVTHFGICNADHDRSFSVEIHRKVKYTTGGEQQIIWHNLVTAVIGYNGRFTFHTNLPGSYRQRLIASGGTPIEQLAVGAAYTKSPPVRALK